MGRIEADAPRVLYVSYDGAGEPLGRSQVVAYLLGLAGHCRITLISFEKPGDDREGTRAILDAAGIEWIPLRYHKRPPVLSTAWDIALGAFVTRRAARRARTEIVHVRSYVAGVIALLGGLGRSSKLLFDIRGFWVDERVEGGIWPRGGWLYRIGKRCERRLFRSADAVVTLTEASVPQIRSWLGTSAAPVRVIPTCAELERYGGSATAGSARLVWCGSIGTFYRFDRAVALADAAGLPLLVLTRQLDAARRELGDRAADVRTVPHERIGDELAGGGFGLCLYSDGFANLARAPTRFAEFLAAGMAVAVSPGVGDLEALVAEHRVGVVLGSEDPEALRAGARGLHELADDPDTPARCRALAAGRFSLETGVERYLGLYRELLGDGATRGGDPARAAMIGP